MIETVYCGAYLTPATLIAVPVTAPLMYQLLCSVAPHPNRRVIAAFSGRQIAANQAVHCYGED